MRPHWAEALPFHVHASMESTVRPFRPGSSSGRPTVENDLGFPEEELQGLIRKELSSLHVCACFGINGTGTV